MKTTISLTFTTWGEVPSGEEVERVHGDAVESWAKQTIDRYREHGEQKVVVLMRRRQVVIDQAAIE